MQLDCSWLVAQKVAMKYTLKVNSNVFFQKIHRLSPVANFTVHLCTFISCPVIRTSLVFITLELVLCPLSVRWLLLHVMDLFNPLRDHYLPLYSVGAFNTSKVPSSSVIFYLFILNGANISTDISDTEQTTVKSGGLSLVHQHRKQS